MMRVVQINRDFDSWRTAARALLAQNIPPAEIWFQTEENLLAAGLVQRVTESSTTASVSVPKDFLSIATRVACHRDPARFNLLYRILWRLTHGEKHLLDIPIDDDVAHLHSLDKQVRFDRHKMTAFVRFRRIERDGVEHFIAWHQPDHFIVKLTAPFFVKRFGGMRWSILTPDDCAHWDGENLTFTPGVDRSAAPRDDQLEELWTTYYANIFNPARIKLGAMKKEMPVRFWKNLPEAATVSDLLANAQSRTEAMMARKIDDFPTAAAFLPQRISLSSLRTASKTCEGCPLCRVGTQTVFGEGPAGAQLVFVGEQPGDQEDLAGKPFVGPAGRVFDQALQDVGLDRKQVYVTNAVKHFKWEPRGKRRIHAKPNSREIDACMPWLRAELDVIHPRMVVCMGATAAQALLGRDFRVTKSRGVVMHDTGVAPSVLATVHPSSILRTPDEDREAAYQAFVADLKNVAAEMRPLGKTG